VYPIWTLCPVYSHKLQARDGQTSLIGRQLPPAVTRTAHLSWYCYWSVLASSRCLPLNHWYRLTADLECPLQYSHHASVNDTKRPSDLWHRPFNAPLNYAPPRAAISTVQCGQQDTGSECDQCSVFEKPSSFAVTEKYITRIPVKFDSSRILTSDDSTCTFIQSQTLVTCYLCLLVLAASYARFH